MRQRKRTHVAPVQSPLLAAPEQVGQEWSVDFSHGTLASRRSFRLLHIVESYDGECLAIEVDTSLQSARLIRVLERVGNERGLLQRLHVDNGPECASGALGAWAYENGMQLTFIQPGKPMQNGYVESFNRKFQDKCLDLHCFVDLNDAQEIIEVWRKDYDTVRLSVV